MFMYNKHMWIRVIISKHCDFQLEKQFFDIVQFSCNVMYVSNVKNSTFLCKMHKISVLHNQHEIEQSDIADPRQDLFFVWCWYAGVLLN